MRRLDEGSVRVGQLVAVCGELVYPVPRYRGRSADFVSHLRSPLALVELVRPHGVLIRPIPRRAEYACFFVEYSALHAPHPLTVIRYVLGELICALADGNPAHARQLFRQLCASD